MTKNKLTKNCQLPIKLELGSWRKNRIRWNWKSLDPLRGFLLLFLREKRSLKLKKNLPKRKKRKKFRYFLFYVEKRRRTKLIRSEQPYKDRRKTETQHYLPKWKIRPGPPQQKNRHQLPERFPAQLTWNLPRSSRREDVAIKTKRIVESSLGAQKRRWRWPGPSRRILIWWRKATPGQERWLIHQCSAHPS